MTAHPFEVYSHLRLSGKVTQNNVLSWISCGARCETPVAFYWLARTGAYRDRAMCLINTLANGSRVRQFSFWVGDLILIPSRRMSFVEALWPPMEEGGRADEGWVRLERNAVLGLRIFEVLDAGEMAVDEWRIGQGPQMFSGLEFGGVGREEV